MPATAKTQTIGGQQVNTAEMTGFGYSGVYDALNNAKKVGEVNGGVLSISSAGVPKTYYHKTTDSIEQVLSPGYFDAATELSDGDKILAEVAGESYELKLVGGVASVVKPQGSRIAVATQAQGYGREYPTLRKTAFNPIVELSDQTASSVMWPYLVDLSVSGEEGYALFWSTDHGSHAASGTWMATAPSLNGPWTHHGMVFRDDITGGEQHETPSVEWDEVNSRWLQYYQLKFVPGYINQLTLVATADRIRNADGTPTTWTVIGVAIPEYYTNNAGDGHTGYFKPFRYDGGWYGFGLYGGTNNSRKAFYTSYDNGLTYQPHPQILQNGQNLIAHLDGFDPENWMIKHNSGAIINHNNQLWLIAPVGAGISGGAEIPMGKICAFRIGSDGVTLSKAIDITPSLQQWEDQTLGVDQLGSAVMWQGRMYVVYRQGGGDGGFGLMEVL